MKHIPSPTLPEVDNISSTCALCGSRELTLLFRTRDRHYGIVGEFEIVQCTRCSLAFLSPMPSQEELASFYPDDYYAYKAENRRRPVWKKMAARLLNLSLRTRDPYFPTPGRFLDIGCGSGAYLGKMQELGWDVYGAELSGAAVRCGQQAGYANLRCGTVQQAHFNSEYFDYIRTNHAFEHIRDPVPTLQDIYRILKPGGKLFIGVPNLDSIPFRIFGRYWWYLGAPVHTYTYSPRTLGQLLETTGFVVEKIHFNSNYASILGSLQIFFNRHTRKKSTEGFLMRNPLLIIPSNVLAWIFDLMRKGDAIEVICRKPFS